MPETAPPGRPAEVEPDASDGRDFVLWTERTAINGLRKRYRVARAHAAGEKSLPARCAYAARPILHETYFPASIDETR